MIIYCFYWQILFNDIFEQISLKSAIISYLFCYSVLQNYITHQPIKVLFYIHDFIRWYHILNTQHNLHLINHRNWQLTTINYTF